MWDDTLDAERYIKAPRVLGGSNGRGFSVVSSFSLTHSPSRIVLGMKSGKLRRRLSFPKTSLTGRDLVNFFTPTVQVESRAFRRTTPV